MKSVKSIAHVALALPIDKVFDYVIPKSLIADVKKGMRVEILFNKKKHRGYVVGLSERSNIKKLNPILSCVDEGPLLTSMHFALSMKIMDHYVASWGEVLDAMLPAVIKQAKKISPVNETKIIRKQKIPLRSEYVQIYDDAALFAFYAQKIKEQILDNKKVLILVPEVRMMYELSDYVAKNIQARLHLWHGKLPKKKLHALWGAMAKNEVDILIANRSGVFLPLSNIGLIILHHENSASFKEDQVPYYHARSVAEYRVAIEHCGYIASSVVPSAFMYEAIRKKKISYRAIGSKKYSNQILFTRLNYHDKLDILLERHMASALENKERIYIYHKKKGFATYGYCKGCKKTLMCERCSSYLYYDYATKKLFCSYCSFTLPMKEICPYCNADYIKFEGLGIEKLASNVKRIFPAAAVAATSALAQFLDKQKNFDILVCTNKAPFVFGFEAEHVVIWSVDSLFNTGDYNAAENAFTVLTSFALHTKKKLFIAGSLPIEFYVFRALAHHSFDEFYQQELQSRKELQLPPYFHLGLIALRGPRKDLVDESSATMYNFLQKQSDKKIVLSNPYETFRSRLRGKYYRYILVKAKNLKKLNTALRTLLYEHKSSRVTVTINIDPA